MNNTSNWTGRVHRSLDSAFGPHTARRIDEPAANEARYRWPDRVLYAIAVGVVLLWVAGVLR